MTDDDLCPMSDLPPGQCALPCHQNIDLPAGVTPEPRRGDDPVGVVITMTPAAATQHEVRDTRSRPARTKRPRTACRFVGDEWVTREHVRDCEDRSCEGCKHCGEDHCALFGTCPSHVKTSAGIITCPSCVGEFRGNLAEVEALTALVYMELEHASVESEVANLAGPFADPDQIDARREWITRLYDRRGWCEWPRLALFDLDEQNHPVEVLARWERDLRREYELPEKPDIAVWPLPHHLQRDLLSSSAEFIRTMLDGRFPHDEPFEPCARDVKRLRTHLEGVLSDSRAPETGAPCPKCAADLEGTDRKPPRLVKRHGHWCDDPTCEREHDATGKDDKWVCPDHSEHWWKDEDYRKFVAGAYLAHADRLTTSQIHEQYAIPTGTIRRWSSELRLRPIGKTSHGVLQYRVADVLALRAGETSEKEAVDA